jgi:hypothetical protein
MEKRSVIIKFLKPDVAIVHLIWHIGAFMLLMVLYVAITACENVESSAQAQAFDPVTLRQKSKK